jgi:Ni,Fe-hydrogenase III small subunit
MLDWLRTRLAQPKATVAINGDLASLPERFRGRPSLSSDGSPATSELPVGGSSAFVTTDDRRLPVLDVGACLFSPEEAVDTPKYRISFTRDHRMATSTRDGLVSRTGELELAQALEERTRRLFGRSLRLRSVAAGSCGGCEAELVALGNVVFDLSRFGIQFVASPRHADGIVITGAVSTNMRDALERSYSAVADPKIVIAVGACAISGGPFVGSPAVLDGVPSSIPVDLWIPGCPPHPLTLLDGMLRMLGRLEGGHR